MSTQDWEAHVRRFYTMTPGQQNEEWQKMSPEQREAFEAARDRVAKDDERKAKRRGVWQWVIRPVIGIAILVVMVRACVAGYEKGVTTPARYEAPSPISEPAPDWTPKTFTGTGPQDTDDFYVGASKWRACYTITKAARLSDGTPIGYLSVTVYTSSGDRVGFLAGDADGSTHGCTTIRSGPGSFYFHVNVGAGLGWRAEARP